MSTRKPSQLDPLLRLSARLGHDPLLIQGSAGNTSMKIDGQMWIKASGKRLAAALHDEIFLPIEISKNAQCWDEQFQADTWIDEAPKHKLRPSVETPMHAVLPHKVVAHVHSVNSLAHAVRMDAEEHLEPLLEGIGWAWVPYASSGAPLAKQIKTVLERSPEASVFVLGNHGLVVGAWSCDE